MKSRTPYLGWLLGALLSLTPPSATALFCGGTSCVMQTARPGIYLVEVDGPIEGALVRDIEAVLRKGGRINSFSVVRSPGGDLEAAMTLGRLLRAQQVSVGSVHGECASACVFAIAGTLYREYFEDSKAKIGLHRPYFASASSSPAEAGQRIKALNVALRAYLEEMNVSTALLDAMNAVPSDQIRWVTPKEVNRLGLLDADPAYEEYEDGKQAAKLGVSRTEYLGRKAEFKKQCQANFTYLQPEFCACVDRVKFRAPGDKWACDYRNTR